MESWIDETGREGSLPFCMNHAVPCGVRPSIKANLPRIGGDRSVALREEDGGECAAVNMDMDIRSAKERYMVVWS